MARAWGVLRLCVTNDIEHGEPDGLTLFIVGGSGYAHPKVEDNGQETRIVGESDRLTAVDIKTLPVESLAHELSVHGLDSRLSHSDIMPAIHTDRRLLIDMLTPEAHEQLFAGSRRVSFDRGDVLLPARRKPEFLFFLESGQVLVSDVGMDERLHAFKIVGARSFLLLTDLFAEGRLSFEVRALTTCSARQIRLSRLEEMSTRRLDVAAPLVKIMQSLALEAYSVASERMILSAECRLARVLLRLVASHGQNHRDGVAIATKLTQSQVAHVAGTTRQMASTWITNAQRKDILTLDGKTLVIKNLRALEQLAMATDNKSE